MQRLIKEGLSIWGTCVGMILLANNVGPEQALMGVMDIAVKRNALGRQVDSFEADSVVPELDGVSTTAEEGLPFPAVFIRASSIESVGTGVAEVAHLPDGTIVAARQHNLLATAFHPELTEDTRFHRYYLQVAQ